MQAQRIKSIKEIGIQDTLDLEVNHPDHNFYANGIVTSNSHSVSYSQMGYISAYIKCHYPLQFFCALMNYAQYEQKPLEEIFECIAEFDSFGIKILPPSIDKITNKFTIENGAIRYPIGLIRAMGDTLFEKLKTLTPIQTSSLDRCLEALLNSGLNSRTIESMIISGSLDKFETDREEILFYYWFLSELQPDILEKFWMFKNGHKFSEELVFNFLNHREEISKKSKEADMFPETKINTKIKYKSYFKTEITREKVLGKTNEYLKNIKDFQLNKGICRFFWEMYVLGFSPNCRFGNRMKTYSELEAMPVKQSMHSYGIVEDIMFRIAKSGNDYANVVLKLDKKIACVIFSETAIAAKGLVHKDDFVHIIINKTETSLKIDSINVMNNERSKYEFWRKEKVV